MSTALPDYYHPSSGSGLESRQPDYDATFGRFQFQSGFWSVIKQAISFRLLVIGVFFILLLFLSTASFWLVAPYIVIGFYTAGYSFFNGRKDAGTLFTPFRFFPAVTGALLIRFLLRFGILTVIAIMYVIVAWILGSGLSQTGSGLESAIYIYFFFAFPCMAYFSARLQLVYPLIMFRRYRVGDAFRASRAMTKNSSLSLFMMKLFTEFLLPVLGLLVFGLGIFFTLPIVFLLEGYSISRLFGEDLDDQWTPESN